MSSSSRNSPAPSKQDLIKEGLSPWACVSCASRKVRCDRKNPCSNCTKTGQSCEYKAPAPPQRKRRKAERDALNAMIDRMKQYEDYMKSIGVTFEPFDTSSLPNQEARRDSREADVEDQQGQSEFTEASESSQKHAERSHMATLTREFRDDLQLSDSSGQSPVESRDRYQTRLVSSLILGSSLSQSPTWTGNPPITALWQVFCSNVHPLTHVLHMPTVQQEILTWTSGQSALNSSSRSLMFAICACALVSVSDQECYNLISTSKRSALEMIQSATRDALLDDDFLTIPNLKSLQAFALLITSVQSLQHPHTTSLLTKIAIHSARTLGLHRDGSRHGLSAFDTEMRRRIWWYIVRLNVRATELEGLSESPIPAHSDALLPLNLDDEELQPDMLELPPSNNGATDMIFSFMQCVMLKMSHQQQQSLQERQRDGNEDAAQFIGSDLERIAQLENHVDEHFLSSCDSKIPLHAATSALARAALCKMRLQAISVSLKRPSTANTAPDITATRTFFAHSLRLIGYNGLLQTSTTLRGFSWYVRHQFPWGALINLLRSLSSDDPTSTCGSADFVLRAWQQMDKLHSQNPDLLQTEIPAVRSIQVHVSEMTLQAWDNCYHLLPAQATAEPPDFVQALQNLKQAALSGTGTPQSSASSRAPYQVEMGNTFQSSISAMQDPAQGQQQFGLDPTNPVAVQQGVYPIQLPFPFGSTVDPSEFDMGAAGLSTPPEWTQMQYMEPHWNQRYNE